jgi:hypothetical protein
MEAGGVKIWWDDRPDLPVWKKYTREASKQEHSEKTSIGDGFHECINFAFDHPDNRPAVKLYLPPGYKPRAVNPLLLFGTYKSQQQMGGYWVGAAIASILPSSARREHYQSKNPVKLDYEALADPMLVTPFVVPIRIDPLRHLGKQVWHRKPVTISKPARLLKEAASAAAVTLLDEVPLRHRKAVLRELEVVGRMLTLLNESETSSEPHSAEESVNDTTHHGSGWHPDPGLGLYAEEIVLRDQARFLSKLAKRYPDCPKRPKHVAKVHPFADHDIESAAAAGNKWVQTVIEVKGTTQADWGTVMISEGQLSLARRCTTDPRHIFAIVEFAEGAKKHTIHYKTLVDLERQFSFAPMKYRLQKR